MFEIPHFAIATFGMTYRWACGKKRRRQMPVVCAVLDAPPPILSSLLEPMAVIPTAALAEGGISNKPALIN